MAHSVFFHVVHCLIGISHYMDDILTGSSKLCSNSNTFLWLFVLLFGQNSGFHKLQFQQSIPAKVLLGSQLHTIDSNGPGLLVLKNKDLQIRILHFVSKLIIFLIDVLH